MYETFKKMPTILKFLTAHALVCFIFLLAAIVPGIPISVNGQEMTITELWSRGFGYPIIFIGVAMPICALLMLKRVKYSRLIYLVILSSSLILPFIYMQEIFSILFGIALTTAIGVYLYGKSTVRSYFSLNEK